MSDADMDAAIRKNFMIPPKQAPKGMMERAKDAVLGDDPLRSIALGAKGVAQGAMTLPLMAGDALNSLLNLGLPSKAQLPMASQSAESLLTRAGAPSPQNPSEKVLQEVSKGASAGALFPA